MQVSKRREESKVPQVLPAEKDPEFRKSLLDKKNIVKFLVVPLIPLLIIAYLSADTNLWTVGGEDHFYFEMISDIFV